MARQEAEHATTEITEVAPGILRMQLPLNMPGLGHVNCYAMEDERGYTLVDPGMPGPQPWKVLMDRFERAGFAMRNVHSRRGHALTHRPLRCVRAGCASRQGLGVVTSRSFRTWWDPSDAGERELEAVDGDTDVEVPPDPRRPVEPADAMGRQASEAAPPSSDPLPAAQADDEAVVRDAESERAAGRRGDHPARQA